MQVYFDRRFEFWYTFLIFPYRLMLISTASQAHFTSSYQGRTVTGLVGSSVNFTWIFSGHVLSILWGLKKDHGIDDNGKQICLTDRATLICLCQSHGHILDV